MTRELRADQTEELHQSLRALERELEQQLAGAAPAERGITTGEDAGGRVSRMDAIQRQQMADAERRRLENRLRMVRKALQRVADEEYGICTRCEQPIGYARLRARPESLVCIRCQERIESAR